MPAAASGYCPPPSPVLQVNTKKGKWGIFVIAFTTTLREGLEAVIFIAGVSAGLPVSSVPIPAVVGIIMGITVGVILYYRWVLAVITFHSPAVHLVTTQFVSTAVGIVVEDSAGGACSSCLLHAAQPMKQATHSAGGAST